ncbi:transposase [Streptomyces sp. NPDC054796]
MSVLVPVGGREALAELSRFRTAFYGCLSARADAFFELTEALLCADGPTRTPVELSLLAEHQRGYGSLYGALNRGRLNTDRLRDLLVSLPLPRFEGRLVLTVDVSAWLRSDAACSPERLFCHVHGRSREAAQIIPGWPYSFVAALTPDRTSWTRVLDAVRLGPADDAAAVTADQLRAVVERLIAAGQWQRGDRNMLVVMDAGYDVMRLAWVLRDLPVELVGRLALGPRPAAAEAHTQGVRCGLPPRRPAAQTRQGVPPRPARVVAGAVGDDPQRHLPLRQGRSPCLGPAAPEVAAAVRVDRPRQRAPRHRGHADPAQRRSPARRPRRTTGVAVVLGHRRHRGRRRLHLVLLPAQIRPGTHIPSVQAVARLGPPTVTRPAGRRPVDLACDRRAHSALRLAAPLAADRRKPWEKATSPGQVLTPARVRRGFRHLRPNLAQPARAPKPSRPGPGRPPGSRNRHPASRYDVGKTVRRPANITERDEQG